jgi:hypothetical protein
MGSNHGEDEININDRANINERMEKFMDKGKLEENLSQKFKELDKLRAKEPDGKLPPIRLTPQDQGDIRFSVGISMDKKRVVINFGKQIRWVGMNRNQAIEVGRALIKSAKETVI